MKDIISLRPWLLLAVLTLLNILNYTDRFLLTAFAPAIIRDLQLTTFQFTLLAGLIFMLSFTVFGLLAGALSDRLHRPRLIALGVSAWSALTAATGFAGNFLQLAAARVLIGVGESVLSPTALSMLSDSVPRQRRALASGIFTLGIPVGVGMAFLYASTFGPVLGWRGSFIAVGLAGLGLAALVALLRDPVRGQLDNRPQSNSGSGRTLRQALAELLSLLRTSPALGFTLLGGAAMNFVSGSSVLDVVWWVRELGFNENKAQAQIGLIFLLGGTTGALLGGFGADWCYRRFAAGRFKFLVGAQLVTATAAVGYRLADPATPLFYILAFLNSVNMLVVFGAAVTSAQDLVPVSARGLIIAVMMLCNTLLGYAPGSAAVGYLTDMLMASGVDQPIGQALFLCSLPGLLAIPCFHIAGKSLATQPDLAVTRHH